MQTMIVLQSLWAMERRHTDGVEPSLEESLQRIEKAGFDGISAHWCDAAVAARLDVVLRDTAMRAVEGLCFPKTVNELKPALDTCARYPVHHLNLQPDVRVRKLGQAVTLIEGWMRLAEQVDFPVYIETHRDRLTTDLLFTLDLLDEMPTLTLLADLPHFLVGSEFSDPVTDENHALIQRILDSSWAFHGRIGSREQVQIEIPFPHHAPWVDLFRRWWVYGFRSWCGWSATGRYSPVPKPRPECPEGGRAPRSGFGASRLVAQCDQQLVGLLGRGRPWMAGRCSLGMVSSLCPKACDIHNPDLRINAIQVGPRDFRVSYEHVGEMPHHGAVSCPNAYREPSARRSAKPCRS